jgi:hypothetical protein
MMATPTPTAAPGLFASSSAALWTVCILSTSDAETPDLMKKSLSALVEAEKISV